MTAAYALAHVFLLNHTKLRGPATLMSALERKEKAFFASVWTQAHVEHDPKIVTESRDPYQIAVMSLPQPKEMGEAHFVAWVTKKSDPQYSRYFLLEHDYVLAKQANRTVLTERHGKEHIKHGDGSPITGDFAADAKAFVDVFMARIDKPATVARG
ncbi:MAG: hypothetical protein ABI867_31510 [Kofleriaceae bacterium]